MPHRSRNQIALLITKGRETIFIRKGHGGMKMNKKSIILSERAADYERHRAVLREWGYRENESHRLLKEQRVDQTLNDRGQKDDSIQRGASLWVQHAK